MEASPEAAGLVADVEVSPAVHQQPVDTTSDYNFLLYNLWLQLLVTTSTSRPFFCSKPWLTNFYNVIIFLEHLSNTNCWEYSYRLCSTVFWLRMRTFSCECFEYCQRRFTMLFKLSYEIRPAFALLLTTNAVLVWLGPNTSMLPTFAACGPTPRPYHSLLANSPPSPQKLPFPPLWGSHCDLGWNGGESSATSRGNYSLTATPSTAGRTLTAPLSSDLLALGALPLVCVQ